MCMYFKTSRYSLECYKFHEFDFPWNHEQNSPWSVWYMESAFQSTPRLEWALHGPLYLRREWHITMRLDCVIKYSSHSRFIWYHNWVAAMISQRESRFDLLHPNSTFILLSKNPTTSVLRLLLNSKGGKWHYSAWLYISANTSFLDYLCSSQSRKRSHKGCIKSDYEYHSTWQRTSTVNSWAST